MLLTRIHFTWPFAPLDDAPAERVARKYGARFVTGEAIGQVASQTMEP